MPKIRKDSAANFLNIKAKQSKETAKAAAERLESYRAKSIQKRWNREPGERCSLKLLKAGHYVQMDCGCIVKIVNWTKTLEGSVRPLVVVENDACEKIAGEVECRMVTGDKVVPGMWRRRTPGYKSHTIGTTWYDIGQIVTVLDKEKLMARWKKELKDAL